LNREHYALHGGMRALHAPEPRQNLPESYGDKLRERRLFVVGRAAALTDGRVADGNLTLELGGVGSSAIVLATHAAYRIVAPTLEPVARPGDILLVNLHKEPSERSLVVARFDDRIVARRFEVADNHSDLAVFTAKAINPRRIAAPIVVKRATIEINKVVGVLFSSDAASAPAGAEICDCGGEATSQAVPASVKGIVEVSGASAEPYALDGQMLLIGEPVDPTTALKNFDGKLVIAGDTSGARYFKRWRSDGRGVVLESLEIGGEFGPVVSTIDAGAETDITKVWPVLGVLFERP
jgi:SOS-response transcriptional repressor LexA